MEDYKDRNVIVTENEDLAWDELYLIAYLWKSSPKCPLGCLFARSTGFDRWPWTLSPILPFQFPILQPSPNMPHPFPLPSGRMKRTARWHAVQKWSVSCLCKNGGCGVYYTPCNLTPIPHQNGGAGVRYLWSCRPAARCPSGRVHADQSWKWQSFLALLVR